VWSKKWIQAPAGISYEEVDLKQLRVSGGAYVLRIRSGKAEEQVKIVFTP
jgi:hypothetical protein